MHKLNWIQISCLQLGTTFQNISWGIFFFRWKSNAFCVRVFFYLRYVQSKSNVFTYAWMWVCLFVFSHILLFCCVRLEIAVFIYLPCSRRFEIMTMFNKCGCPSFQNEIPLSVRCFYRLCIERSLSKLAGAIDIWMYRGYHDKETPNWILCAANKLLSLSSMSLCFVCRIHCDKMFGCHTKQYKGSFFGLPSRSSQQQNGSDSNNGTIKNVHSQNKRHSLFLCVCV